MDSVFKVVERMEFSLGNMCKKKRKLKAQNIKISKRRECQPRGFKNGPMGGHKVRCELKRLLDFRRYRSSRVEE